MSLIHKALDRPGGARPGRSGYNPLGRRPGSGSGLAWWLVAGAALATAAVIVLYPQSPDPVPSDAPASAQASGGDTGMRAEPSANESATAAESADIVLLPPPASPDSGKASAPDPPPPEPATEPEEPTESTPEAPPQAPTQTETARSEPEPQPTSTTVAEQPRDEPQADPAPAPGGAQGDSDQAPRVRVSETGVGDRQAGVTAALARDDRPLAEQRLRAWMTDDPDDPRPRLWLAKLHLNAGRPDAAAPLLSALESSEALALKALMHEQAGRPAQAATLFETLTRRQPAQGRWWLHWAINAENSGRLARARLLYQTYLDDFSADNVRLATFAQGRLQAMDGN